MFFFVSEDVTSSSSLQRPVAAGVRSRKRQRTLKGALLVTSGAALWSSQAQQSATFVYSRARQERVASGSNARRHLLACSGVPIRFSEGGNLLPTTNETFGVLLETDADATITQATSDSGETLAWSECRAVLPQEKDIEPLADLLVQSFSKLWEPWLLSESFGIVAEVWNAAYMNANRQIAIMGIRDSIEKRIKKPSIMYPLGFQLEGYSLGFMVVPKNSDVPVAYSEIFLMPSDGTQPEDAMVQILPMIQGSSPPSNWQPYLVNLCVAPSYRRSGLGRATMQLAEFIAKEAWRKDWVYLHADNEAYVTKFYSSIGYTADIKRTNPEENDKVVYMRKWLGQRPESTDESPNEDISFGGGAVPSKFSSLVGSYGERGR